MSDSLKELQGKALRFRDERDWAQFHQPKDLVMGLTVEAAELAELFLWKSDREIQDMFQEPTTRTRVAEELSDVLIFLLYLAHEARIDLGGAVEDKIAANAAKYPVEKSKGTARKGSTLSAHPGSPRPFDKRTDFWAFDDRVLRVYDLAEAASRPAPSGARTSQELGVQRVVSGRTSGSVQPVARPRSAGAWSIEPGARLGAP
jgi:dCTP diphosphatase